MDDQALNPHPSNYNVKMMLGVAMAFFIPLAVTTTMGSMGIDSYDKVFYSRFIYWGTALLLLGYAYFIEKQHLLILAENDKGIGFLVVSVVALLLAYIGASLVSAIPMLLGMREKNEVMHAITKLLRGHNFMVFFIALTAGVTEELIFRGYVLTRLMKLFKDPVIPILISSALFSALHYKYNSLRELIFAFLIGVIFSIYYVKYRNIKALMVTHFLIDFISLSLAQHFMK
jgi:membrane protease YdiL (CAAX protease family)